MNDTIHVEGSIADRPLHDHTRYGAGKDDSVTEATEHCAVTHHTVSIKGKTINYTARAGHLATVDMYSGQPTAKIFYVAFTADTDAATNRPVTFFYNGGPGSSAVFLLLGSFGPRRIKTSMPYFTPPAPYALEDNQDSLLDVTDMVFINPVGTGYSAAITPNKNRDFWGVDQDAQSIKQFVKRYLTVYRRWNSPKFLFGESYGTPRTCVLTWLLHEDGVDLNGVILQSSILDYGNQSNPVGLLPTLAADALYHNMVKLTPVPSDLPTFMSEVERFARGAYASAIKQFPTVKPETLKQLSNVLGIPSDVLKYWKLDPSPDSGAIFLTSLLQNAGLALGAYDGRVTGDESGIAGSVSPDAGNNDPTLTAVGGVYTAMWNVYLNEELQYTSVSSFIDINDQAFANWNFGHVDPTGEQKGGQDSLYTAGDLAASMELNPCLKVFSANGYYDAVTPFFQTILNFEAMPLGQSNRERNLTVHMYPSGHMVYLDDSSRSAMKHDLAKFYAAQYPQTYAAAAPGQQAKEPQPPLIRGSRYRRRFARTPY